MVQNALVQAMMPSTYVRHVAQEFSDHVRLAANSGISPTHLLDYTLPISVAQHLQIIRNAVEMADRADWYMDWGQRMAAHFHGPITLAMLSARCLGDGLDAFLKYIPNRVPYHRWAGYRERDHFVCEVEELIDLGVARTTLVEIPLLVMHEYVRTLRPGPLTGAFIEVNYAAPPHVACYAQRYRCPVAFGRARNALRIPLVWREVRNVGYDEATWFSALQQCAALSVARDELNTLNAVRRLLFNYFDRLDPERTALTLDQVADALHMSSRTLIRRLRAQNTTFQAVADGIQMHRARDLLANPALRVHAIARQLGYRDATGFVRAFKRWYGTTPGAFRTREFALSGLDDTPAI
jgi:AraC-like DNA-binding protein